MQMYSNGVSEVIIGKAVKQHNLPREKLVIRIKVQFFSNIPAES